MKVLIYVFTVLILVSCSNEQNITSEQDLVKDQKYNWR